MSYIELVIDIPKYVYDTIVANEGYIADCDNEKVGMAIKNGTPLPKGHGDLIDVNRKITASVYDDEFEFWFEETMTVLEALNKWSDEGVRAEDVVIPADMENEDNE